MAFASAVIQAIVSILIFSKKLFGLDNIMNG